MIVKHQTLWSLVGAFAIGGALGWFVGKQHSKRTANKNTEPQEHITKVEESKQKENNQTARETQTEQPSPCPKEKFRRKVPTKKPRVIVTPEMVSKWAALKQSGMTHKQISVKTGVPKVTIDRHLAKWSKRTKGETSTVARIFQQQP